MTTVGRQQIAQRLVSLLYLLAVATPSASIAGEVERIIHGTNNFSHRAAECAAFFTVVAQCLEGKDHGLTLLSRLRAKQALIVAKKAGGVVGVSDAALTARMQIAINTFAAKIEKNCTNVSVILLNEGEKCKFLIDHPEDALNAEIAAVNLKPVTDPDILRQLNSR